MSTTSSAGVRGIRCGRFEQVVGALGRVGIRCGGERGAVGSGQLPLHLGDVARGRLCDEHRGHLPGREHGRDERLVEFVGAGESVGGTVDHHGRRALVVIGEVDVGPHDADDLGHQRSGLGGRRLGRGRGVRGGRLGDRRGVGRRRLRGDRIVVAAAAAHCE
jgi:hypothetical protein